MERQSGGLGRSPQRPMGLKTKPPEIRRSGGGAPCVWQFL